MDFPRRIVCLTEEPTEILYRLGEGDRVVGISAYTVRPAEVRGKPVVSAFQGGSVEKILAQRPDLVIGFSDIQAELARQLISAGLAVLIFNQRSIEEILGVILAVGRLVGVEDRARRLIEELRQGMAAVAAAAPAEKPRVYFEEWDDPMICGIGWVSELIEIAGGVDVFRERARSGAMARERQLLPADVVAARPDVVLASWCGKPFDADAFMARPGFAGIPAVRDRRLHEIDPALILQPGPAALDEGLAALAAHIRA